MLKKIFFLLLFFVSDVGFSQTFTQIDPLDKMPILDALPTGVAAGDVPIEQRGEAFRRYLSSTLKISVSGASGSGTIVYYDRGKNIAYIASCGHLWSSGIMNYQEAKSRNLTCRVTTWYHNEKKLDVPRSYVANILFYSNIPGYDTSLLAFSPDWEPNYFPIAPVKYPYEKGKVLNSVGCDGGSEVAHYEVQILGIGNQGLETIRNSPRPGRSGGGLLDDAGWYVGTCWGTQYRNGSGKGFFTPLEAIHKTWKENNFEFLLGLEPPGVVARKIPIKDRNQKQGFYTPDYILIPGFNF